MRVSCRMCPSGTGPLGWWPKPFSARDVLMAEVLVTQFLGCFPGGTSLGVEGDAHRNRPPPGCPWPCTGCAIGRDGLRARLGIMCSSVHGAGSVLLIQRDLDRLERWDCVNLMKFIHPNDSMICQDQAEGLSDGAVVGGSLFQQASGDQLQCSGAGRMWGSVGVTQGPDLGALVQAAWSILVVEVSCDCIPGKWPWSPLFPGWDMAQLGRYQRE